MPADLVKRIDLDKLYPPFLERVLQTLANCRARGADYYAILGFRPYAESARLHMNWLAGKGGRAAPAGKSSHNFGLAIDACRDSDLDKPGLQPDWRAERYRILGEEAAKLGLHWGAGYGDRPHISWPGYVTGADLEPLRRAWEQSTGTDLQRLATVWRLVK